LNIETVQLLKLSRNCKNYCVKERWHALQLTVHKSKQVMMTDLFQGPNIRCTSVHVCTIFSLYWSQYYILRLL